MGITEIIARMKSGYDLRCGKKGWRLSDKLKLYPKSELFHIDSDTVNSMFTVGLITVSMPFLTAIATLTEKGENYNGNEN